jgi:uncharacterized membrane protein YdbT with pleckstrin-like domain
VIPAKEFVLPEEDVWWSGRPRLRAVLPAAAFGLALVIGGLAVFYVTRRQLPLAFVPVGVALGLWGYLVVTNTRFVVTDRAVYRKRGVLSRDVRRIAVDRIQDSSFRQGVRGRLFGYGTVVVQAAGGGSIRFHEVENPREVRALVDRRAADDGDGVPGSVGQWQAVLEEVRTWRAALES